MESFLILVGSIFVAFFSEKILMLLLIKNLYQVEDKEEISDSPLLTNNFKTSKVTPINPIIKEEEEKKLPSPTMNSNKNIAMHVRSMVEDDDIDLDELEDTQPYQEMTELQQEVMDNKLKTDVNRRRNYEYIY
jgi:hypothetical protein